MTYLKLIFLYFLLFNFDMINSEPEPLDELIINVNLRNTKSKKEDQNKYQIPEEKGAKSYMTPDYKISEEKGHKSDMTTDHKKIEDKGAKNYMSSDYEIPEDNGTKNYMISDYKIPDDKELNYKIPEIKEAKSYMTSDYKTPEDNGTESYMTSYYKTYSEECCQEAVNLTTYVEYILMDHSLTTCYYRELHDTSTDPDPDSLKIVKRTEGFEKDFKCIDDVRKSNCEAPHFVTWYDVISRCFHQETEGQELMDSSFCQPQPSHGFVKKFNAAVDKLESLVNTDKYLSHLAERMWIDSPSTFRDFCPGNFSNMIRYLRVVMKKAPQFMAKSTPSGLPQIQMLICYIRSPAGKIFFGNEEVNEAIVGIEKAWAKFLDSEESLSVINDSQFGWKSECARKMLKMKDYKHDPNGKYWGFKSFNEFFGRALKNGSRPNRCLPNPDEKCMISYGDSQRLKITRNLKLTTETYAKNENYSLLSMFAYNKTLANYFVGGSLMQTLFLPDNYHRYHAPVSGTIVFAKIIPGILFAIHEDLTTVDEKKPHREKLEHWIDKGVYGYINSKTYISHVASRAIFVIETKTRGYVCAIAIGLQTISSTLINDDIYSGAHVEQGQELGRFQYGGSTGIVLVSDKDFRWFAGIGDEKDFYYMGQRVGEFDAYTADYYDYHLEEDSKGPFWGAALGFPVL